MVTFLQELKFRNPTLFLFGLGCLVTAFVFFALSKNTNTQVYGVNAWYKPLKFALSTWLFSWTMAWYCYYLANFNIHYFNWSIIILLGFEVVYISIMAGRGTISHYNTTTPFYSLMFTLMALFATLATLHAAYVGYLFFTQPFPELPNYYLWAIRLAIVIFVVFSFQGFAMGARMSHTIGALNDNSNLFIVGWSKTVGDLRVSHFIGMHALQVLPILSFYVLKNTKATFIISVLYGLLAISTLVQALQGKPLIGSKLNQKETVI